ncbi:fructosamine kinase family protein [Seonamhaeicola marinus]|uniref:Fructosamine kinase family protein n=1 Tax=Seonamhaeicola marinus TaxID=1912246 RepID=A0A5D0J7V1_9FLAO|nr:fructosamine kinase family protein [Seonamhaeicola marinus]TYA92273.1 fructosamine kinase family protein [Seonamhaeicola marinus]
MLQNAFIKYLENLLSEKVISTAYISGGDISEAFYIETEKQKYFLKTNTLDKLKMFDLEAKGLQAIAKTNTIATPKIYQSSTFSNSSYLLMEWIESKPASNQDFQTLGKRLAQLHNTSTDSFGFEHNNFIGSLSQSNKKHLSWTDFYIKERLQKQLDLANASNLLSTNEIPTTSTMQEVLQPLFQNIKPSLLHGDLWSGNYLMSSKGVPYLIDPAVYYGHGEIDIAMTKLFGGFSNAFYEAYFNSIPPDTNTNLRIEIYQLYYLLVHLNLFGKSYYGSVTSILRKFF